MDPASAHQPIRLLIVDDVPQVRQDLRILLDLCAAVEVIGEAGNGQEAIRQAERLRPEVVLMDLEMPVLDGYAAARQIKARCPACRVIAFSVHSYAQAVKRAEDAGMDGFIEKGASLGRIVEVVRNGGKGRIFVLQR